jgi:hypothetical protein
VLKHQLTLEEIAGHTAVVSGGGHEKAGFACNPCIEVMRKDPNMTLVEVESDISELEATDEEV